MPIYDYKCDTCGRHTEEKRTFSEMNTTKVCRTEGCNGVRVKELLVGKVISNNVPLK